MKTRKNNHTQQKCSPVKNENIGEKNSTDDTCKDRDISKITTKNRAKTVADVSTEFKNIDSNLNKNNNSHSALKVSGTNKTGDINMDIENFWNIGNYDNTIKRAGKSIHMLTLLSSLFEEKANIEVKIGKLLNDWANKFKNFIDTNINNDSDEIYIYGDYKEMLNNVVEFDLARSRSHINVLTKLQSQCSNPISDYLSQNYHKVNKQLTSSGLKELEELKSDFEDAQKPWIEVLSNIEKTKLNFHTQCLKTPYRNQDLSEKKDLKEKKGQEGKLNKQEKKLNKSAKKYIDALDHMNALSKNYKLKMQDVFDRAQETEKNRLSVIKNVFAAYISIFDFNNDNWFITAKNSLDEIIQKLNPEAEILKWSKLHGADMPFSKPVFEEPIPIYNKKRMTLFRRATAKNNLRSSKPQLPCGDPESLPYSSILKFKNYQNKLVSSNSLSFIKVEDMSRFIKPISEVNSPDKVSKSKEKIDASPFKEASITSSFISIKSKSKTENSFTLTSTFSDADAKDQFNFSNKQSNVDDCNIEEKTTVPNVTSTAFSVEDNQPKSQSYSFVSSSSQLSNKNGADLNSNSQGISIFLTNKLEEIVDLANKTENIKVELSELDASK